MTETLSPPDKSIDFVAARKAMIDSQLRTSGVNEPFVLARMNAVPREEHVPASARGAAYIDRAVSLGEGGALASPLFYGRMLEEADPKSDDRVLVVDNGSGYIAALFEPLVDALESVSADEATGKSRKKGDFTLLLIDGAVEAIPDSLAKRIVENGRVVTGLAGNRVTRLASGRKSGTNFALMPLFEMGIPHLSQFDQPKGWSF